MSSWRALIYKGGKATFYLGERDRFFLACPKARWERWRRTRVRKRTTLLALPTRMLGGNVVASRDAAQGAMVAQSTVECVVDFRFEAFQDRRHGGLQAWRWGVTLERRPV
jgi:hypothetical protein